MAKYTEINLYSQIGKADNNNLKYDQGGGGLLVNISGGGLEEKLVVRFAEQYNRDYYRIIFIMGK